MQPALKRGANLECYLSYCAWLQTTNSFRGGYKKDSNYVRDIMFVFYLNVLRVLNMLFI